MKKRERNRSQRMARVAGMTPGERKGHPEDIAGIGARDCLMLFKNRRFLCAWGMMLLPPAGCALWRIGHDRGYFQAVCGMVLAAGVTMVLIQAWMREVLSLNIGIFFRRSEPIRYWINMGLLLIGYLMSVVMILWAD